MFGDKRGIPVWEKILRSVVIYLFILIAFRFTGKRQVGQLTPFDLVLLLIISNVVQNAVIGNDNSLGGGILGAVTILALNYLVVGLAYRFKPSTGPSPPNTAQNPRISRILHSVRP